MQKNSKDDLSEYRMGKFTVLQLMGLLALFGIVVAVALQYWFGA